MADCIVLYHSVSFRIVSCLSYRLASYHIVSLCLALIISMRVTSYRVMLFILITVIVYRVTFILICVVSCCVIFQCIVNWVNLFLIVTSPIVSSCVVLYCHVQLYRFKSCPLASCRIGLRCVDSYHNSSYSAELSELTLAILTSDQSQGQYALPPKYAAVVVFKYSSPYIHPLSVTALSLLWGQGGFCWANPSCLWPTADQEQFGIRYLAHDTTTIAPLGPGLGFEPVTFPSLAELPYPLSYPNIQVILVK